MSEENSKLREKIMGLITSGVDKGYITQDQMSAFKQTMEENNKSKSEKVVFRFLEDEGGKKQELFDNMINTMNDSKSREEMQKKLQGGQFKEKGGDKLYEWMELLWNISGVVKK
jgi:hypothetical protein